MHGAAEMPVQEVLRGLAQTPAHEAELRAAMAVTLARWALAAGDAASAEAHLEIALGAAPDLRPAFRLRQRVALARGDLRGAVLHLDQEIRTTRHPREAAALYRERGVLVETRFMDRNAALQCHLAALKVTPEDLAVLRSLEHTLLQRGDVLELVANLETQLDVVRDPGARAGLLRDLALLEARRGGEPLLACDLLGGALEILPEHRGLSADLLRFAELAGDPETLLWALQTEAELAPPEEQAQPLVRASIVLHELDDRPAAVALLRAAARSQPHNFSLWRNLEDLSMSGSRYEVALEACVGQLRALEDRADPGTRAELFYRLGRLALTRLDRFADGLAAMRRCLQISPHHIPALEETSRHLIAAGMWSQLHELLRAQAAHAALAGQRASEIALAHVRVGQVLEERLVELEGALEAYRTAIGADPTYRPARDRYQRVLLMLGRNDELKRFYEEELERSPGRARSAFLLSLLGRLYADDSDTGPAIRHLAALLKHVHDHLPSLQLLARVLARAGRNEELLKLTRREVKLIASPVRRARLLHRAGELALGLGRAGEAREQFAAAVEAVDDHIPSLDALATLLREDRDHAALVDVLRKRLLYTGDFERQLALRLEIAGILATRLGRGREALGELTAVLQRAPANLPALHAAEHVALGLRAHGELVDLLERHIVAVRGPRTRALLLLQRANVRGRRLGDPEGAILDLERALELWPQLSVARALLLDLLRTHGRHEHARELAESGLAVEQRPGERRALALQLVDGTTTPLSALRLLAAAAEARPDDAVTQLRLASVAHRAGRYPREASALREAHDALARTMAPATAELLALRYRAARAEEHACNLARAAELYGELLALAPDHAPAKAATLRVATRQRELANARRAADFERHAAETDNPTEQAAYLAIAAEVAEREQDFDASLRLLDRAIAANGRYLPALHAKARVLERSGEPAHVLTAIDTLSTLASRQHVARHRARTLCRAGMLALRIAAATLDRGERALGLFCRALDADPGHDPAFFGLVRVRDDFGIEQAPPLWELLERRVDALLARKAPVRALLEVARIGSEREGPACAVELLRRCLPGHPREATVHADLAQGHARLGHWSDAVESIETAIECERSPERLAVLRYFAGDAREHAGSPDRALEHYLAAGAAGLWPVRALERADRLAAELGNLDARARALELLARKAGDERRIESLRALAELEAGPRARPEVAADLLREVLALRPLDIDVVRRLRALLEKSGLHDEAGALLASAVAHHRAFLHSPEAFDGPVEHSIPVALAGLLRLFADLGETDGRYVTAAALEIVGPEHLAGRGADSMVSEPWGLPGTMDGRPFELLFGDLPLSSVIDMLREGGRYLPGIPGAPPPPVDGSATMAPATSGAGVVTRRLAQALSITPPGVFVLPRSDHAATSFVRDGGIILVGRRLGSSPFSALARDRLGRALLRLSTGADWLHRSAGAEQLLGLLCGLARAVSVELEIAGSIDTRMAQSVTEALSGVDDLADLQEAARTAARSGSPIDAESVQATLRMAEDRAAVVCAADPRPALQLLAQEAPTGERAASLLAFLPSDNHLSLRRALGYRIPVELDQGDLEEMPA